MASQHENAVDKAKELGAKDFRSGINWNWINNFPTREAAEAFDEWCKENRYETRGVYPPMQGETGYDVRYRNSSDIVW